MRGQLGAGIALATFVAGSLTGQAGTLFPPLAADVRIDGVALPPTSYFGMLASTMDRQFLGMSPYWGTGPGPLRFSAMRDRARSISARAIVPALRGRPSPWLQPELGYRSHNVDEVDDHVHGWVHARRRALRAAGARAPARVDGPTIGLFPASAAMTAPRSRSSDDRATSSRSRCRAGAHALVERLRERFGPDAARRPACTARISARATIARACVDLYALVSSYRAAHQNAGARRS